MNIPVQPLLCLSECVCECVAVNLCHSQDAAEIQLMKSTEILISTHTLKHGGRFVCVHMLTLLFLMH